MSNLATPTLAVDDETVEFKANSLSYKDGKGDFSIRTQQSGASVTVVANKNAETQLSMVKFTCLTTDVSDAQKNRWLDARETGGCTIDLFDGSIEKAYRGMILMSEPETSTGSEGEIEFEFQGPPLS